MSIFARASEYRCPSSGKLFTRQYEPVVGGPKYVKCRCGNPHAELVCMYESINSQRERESKP
ncbi:hypothetical protein OGZ01_18490 [Vibrio harveyi]|nr:hypothetical protein [Vibrio harveyi]